SLVHRLISGRTRRVSRLHFCCDEFLRWSNQYPFDSGHLCNLWFSSYPRFLGLQAEMFLARRTAPAQIEKSLHDRVIRCPKFLRASLHDNTSLKNPIAFAPQHDGSVRDPEKTCDVVRYHDGRGADSS